MVEKQTSKKTKLKNSKTKTTSKVEKKQLQAKYWEAVGRRKESTARVRIFTKGEGIVVNDIALDKYFPVFELQEIVKSPLVKINLTDKFFISAKVRGGGVRGQAEAIRHGLARALVVFNPNFKKRLRKAGYLTRDPRMKERRKYGLKKARRAPQWSKR